MRRQPARSVGDEQLPRRRRRNLLQGPARSARPEPSQADNGLGRGPSTRGLVTAASDWQWSRTHGLVTGPGGDGHGLG
jgi:hypothetical protein